ncbi:MAG: excinuclease ABC subunit UvrA [Myxococcales bacterium]|nr:excinuclease ABC subunit UvrA [Myxococcales bacterium]
MRTTIEIVGARVNNLRNVSVELPRDQLIALTGVSGSGKTSLAFDTLYAEGQRRLMKSMSSYARRFVQQQKKPDVDFVNGLSPVVSIEQKTVSRSPRSTVGTATDIWDHLRVLAATVGVPHCPWCAAELTTHTAHQLAERLMALPAGTEVELRAPVVAHWGETLEEIAERVRHHGYRHAWLDGQRVDLGDDLPDADREPGHLEAIVDTVVVDGPLQRRVAASLADAASLSDGLFSLHAPVPVGLGCEAHGIVSLPLHHGGFTFNDPAGACPTCTGLGTAMRVHPALLVPDPSRTLSGGALIKEAFNCDPNTWGGRMLWTLHRSKGLPLDVPYEQLSAEHVDMLLQGTGDEVLTVEIPPTAKRGQHYAGRDRRFVGVIPGIERSYQHHRKRGESNAWVDDYLKKVMVEYACPDCAGTRLKRVRSSVTVGGATLPQLGALHLEDLLAFLRTFTVPAEHQAVADILLREITGRLELLVGIGLDYLTLDRRSGTLSGGESQRIRLSTQIGSGLMGMLYVLDEPSIGLHPKDNARMVATLRKLVDLGNTVVVVEHDPDTIRASDFLVEIGPGPGVHGGTVTAAGPTPQVLADPSTLSGQWFGGAKSIAVPPERRTPSAWLGVRGARHNNLADLDVDLPLGVLCCVTGASGSGKSSLVHDIVHKKLINLLQDSRVLSGEHDALEGAEQIHGVIDIDQTPIGASSRSNPATYVGIYDHIRKLFAATEGAKARGYKPARFSFNVAGGRCETCQGDGQITTKMSFLPDVQVDCPACKGARFNADTLQVTFAGLSIADVLDLSIEDATTVFAEQRPIHRKLAVLAELGLGYLTLGHPAPLLSGGEAQRVKLATELSKLKRGKHLLYLLDEPTTGLHLADVDRLLHSLSRLVAAGHSVLVIEHNLDVIKTADWVIDLGPEGGHRGGQLLAAGPPEVVAATEASHTGRFLKPLLESTS